MQLIGLELFSLEKVTINGISFMGCRDIEMFYVSQLRFENSSLLIPDQGSLVLNSAHNVTMALEALSWEMEMKKQLFTLPMAPLYTFSRLRITLLLIGGME